MQPGCSDIQKGSLLIHSAYWPRKPFDLGLKPLPLRLKPFARASKPFRLRLKPFARASKPFRLRLKPFARASKPFGLRFKPSACGSKPFRLRFKLFARDSKPFGLRPKTFVLLPRSPRFCRPGVDASACDLAFGLICCDFFGRLKSSDLSALIL
jgi:hypothetical protein